VDAGRSRTRSKRSVRDVIFPASGQLHPPELGFMRFTAKLGPSDRSPSMSERRIGGLFQLLLLLSLFQFICQNLAATARAYGLTIDY
jgi:hypothetical protein